jgi:PAS domain S-box-containing protein
VIVARRDGTIAFANAQVEQLLGYTRQELVAMPLEMLIPLRFRQQHARHFTAFCAEPAFRSKEGSPELLALTRDGRELPVEMSLGYFRQEPDGLVICTIRNISRRKTEEMRLREALQEVENLRRQTLLESKYLEQELEDTLGAGKLIGESGVIQETRQKIEQVGPMDSSVLILGETGTGKELVARCLHQSSARRNHPLVKVNCATLHHELIESELFGHEKGSFTGAYVHKIGRFELANRSTIFLDEVAEIPLQLQAKLLRVLQEKEFERLGSTTTTRVDVRVIAATNRDIHGMIRDGTFRSDLYFRLAVFLIEIPPLSQRRADIPLLTWHIIRKRQAQLGRTITEIPSDVMDTLTQYDWPGNVRELENVIERGLVVSQGSAFSLGDRLAAPYSGVASNATPASARQLGNLRDVERCHILDVLTKCHWRIKGKGNAADLLGLSPSTLRYRMQKLNIARPDQAARTP